MGLVHDVIRSEGRQAALQTDFDRRVVEVASDYLSDEDGGIGWVYSGFAQAGVCQRSCPVPHQAASLILRSFVSRSGLRQTSPTGDQLRIWRDHRVGLAARASV